MTKMSDEVIYDSRGKPVPVLRLMIAEVDQGRMPQSQLTEERIKVCEECPEFRRMLRQCSVCNCFMDLKTKFLLAACPIDKW